MAQVAIGMGHAEYRAEVVPGEEALHRAGITPLVLGGKDGLALISPPARLSATRLSSACAAHAMSGASQWAGAAQTAAQGN